MILDMLYWAAAPTTQEKLCLSYRSPVYNINGWDVSKDAFSEIHYGWDVCTRATNFPVFHYTSAPPH